MDLQEPLADFLFLWDALLLGLEKVILEYQPDFTGPSSLQGFISWCSTVQIPEEAKVCSPELQGVTLF